jgi:hypothetical protein
MDPQVPTEKEKKGRTMDHRPSVDPNLSERLNAQRGIDAAIGGWGYGAVIVRNHM